MKLKSLLLFVISLSIGASSSATADGRTPAARWDVSLEMGLRRAKAEHKPVVLYFQANWCGWCAKMSKHSLKSESVQTLLQGTVNVRLDVDRVSNSILRTYRVTGYPTTIILDDNGRQICRVSGYAGSDTLGGLLSEAIRAFEELPKLRRRIAANHSDQEAPVAMIAIHCKVEEFEEAKKVLRQLESRTKNRTDFLIASQYNVIGDALQALSRFKEAIPLFEQATKYAATTDQRAYGMLSVAACYASLGQKQKTVSGCMEVLKLPKISKQDKDIAHQMIKNAQSGNGS